MKTIFSQPQDSDPDATLTTNPFKLASWGAMCVLIDQDGNEHEVRKGSAVYRVYRSHGYIEKEVKKS